MENVKYITVAGFDFIITKEITYNSNNYMMAIDEKGANTITFLKSFTENGKTLAKIIDDEEELEFVMELFKKENN